LVVILKTLHRKSAEIEEGKHHQGDDGGFQQGRLISHKVSHGQDAIDAPGRL